MIKNNMVSKLITGYQINNEKHKQLSVLTITF